MTEPGVIVTVLGFLAVIGPLVFLHELGHYLAGRAFGVHAEAFSIGMGKELFGWNDKRGTRWRVAALPIGGYVKFAGDMGPASEPSEEWLLLPPEERARTFQAKPVWQRFLIVLAGPAANFLVAIAIFAGFFMALGEPHTPPVIDQVIAGSAAERAGLKPGDRITAVAGGGVERFEDIAQAVSIRAGMPIAIALERRGRPMTLDAVPATDVQRDRFGNEYRRGLLGIAPGEQVVEQVGPAAAVGAAVRHTVAIVGMIGETIGQIVTGRRSVAELGGPLQIAKFSGERVVLGWAPFVEFVAMISINLGFINLLPIPMLDGGHLVFYLFEGIRRRPVPARAQEWAFRSGLALLLAFMAFVTLNDLGSFGLWRALAGLIG